MILEKINAHLWTINRYVYRWRVTNSPHLQLDDTLELRMDRKSIKVKIFGSEYPLRGESEEFTKKVAGYVDTMINSIHDKIPEQPPLTISVLAALNITEDLLKEKDKNREMISNFESEIIKISNYLDTSLQGNGWFLCN